MLPAQWDYPAPKWPLNESFGLTQGRGEDAVYTELHDREMYFWNNLWSQGQAPMWLINKQTMNVALYCRAFAMAEASLAPSSSGLLGELRQAREDLGLSTAGLSRNKWRFARQDEISVATAEKVQDAAPKGGRKAKGADVVDLFAGVTTRAGS
ncbi:hypothetical protein [Arthrobacter sp. UYCu723]